MRNNFYSKNDEIRELLEKINNLKIAYQTLNPSKKISEDILRHSLLKSALFSARIEGNPLSLNEVSRQSFQKSPESLHKKEVFNLLSAYRFINSKNSPKNISVNMILKLHGLVMKDISQCPGKFRKEPSAIFNQAGVAVYLAPSHFLITDLIKDLVLYVQQSTEPALVKSAITQFAFEKIHPFMDGNGRVGRLISAFILSREGDFDLISCLEEYIDESRNEYYRALEPAKDATSFVEFFLEALLETAKKNFRKQNFGGNKAGEEILLPRRREILEIIKNHPECSFNFIRRRFSSVNLKTLHYDMSQLLKKGFVFKIGGTRGALYKAK